jgi:hypothetical protein
MTQEGQGPRPDETRSPLAPPTSTRWSEDPVEDTPDLAPPFVPGRASGPGPGPAAEHITEETADAVTAPEGAEAPEEPAPFPFETGDADEADEAGMPVPASGDDFPFDQFHIQGDEEEELAPAAYDSGDWITEAPPEAPSDVGTPAVPDTTDAADEAAGEPWDEKPDATEPWGEVASPAPSLDPIAEARPGAQDGVREEIAAMLQHLARTVREEGEPGVRREIDSEDRLTSLIAGLLAGHLSARP